MSRYPFLSASCNGVAPSLYMDVARSVLASGLAPRSRSSWTTCVWPNRAAKCNGVAPAMRRAALLFTSAPLSNKARTVSTWPPRAAKWIGRYPSPKTSLISAPRSSSVKTVFVSPRYAAEDSTGRQPLSGANKTKQTRLTCTWNFMVGTPQCKERQKILGRLHGKGKKLLYAISIASPYE